MLEQKTYEVNLFGAELTLKDADMRSDLKLPDLKVSCTF
jgi:hypothetical protein